MGWLSLGIDWFKYCVKLKQYESMPYWGIALWKLKQAKFEEWLVHIDKSIELELKAKPKALEGSALQNPIIWYVKAVWWVRLRKYDQALDQYSILLPYIK